MKIMPVSKINLKSKFFRKKQGKKVCKVTAVPCYQCFSLRLLLFLANIANWLKKLEEELYGSGVSGGTAVKKKIYVTER